jgi:hypothetical protein
MTAAVGIVEVRSIRPRVLNKKGLWRCGFCTSDNHRSCPAVVRNGFNIKRDGNGNEISRIPRLVTCLCCGDDKPARCLDCGNPHSDLVDKLDWSCIDKFDCFQRLEQRLANSRLYQMLQECKSHSALVRKAARRDRERTLEGVPADEDERLEWELAQARTPRRAARPTSGNCECCGLATKGGKFLPGHDAKLKKILRASARTGDVSAQADLEKRGWA